MSKYRKPPAPPGLPLGGDHMARRHHCKFCQMKAATLDGGVMPKHFKSGTTKVCVGSGQPPREGWE